MPTISFTYSIGSATFDTELEVDPKKWDALEKDERQEMLIDFAYEEVGDMLNVDMGTVKESD